MNLLFRVSIPLVILSFYPSSSFGGISSPLKPFRIKKSSEWTKPEAKDEGKMQQDRFIFLARQRARLISEIEGVLKTGRSADLEIELSLRLAHLYLEDFTASSAQASEQGKTENDTQILAKWSEARRLLKAALAKFRTHARRDALLHSFATVSLEREQIADSIASLQELVKHYPRSLHLDSALVTLADLLFDQAKYDESEFYFAQLVKRDNRSLLYYAMYKMAWCAYNKHENLKAIERFTFVIQKEDPSSKFKMQHEALKDVAFPLADSKSLPDVEKFYAVYDQDVRRSGYEAVALQWSLGGSYGSAIALWEKLLANDARHPSNPTYESGIANALRLSGDENGGFDRVIKMAPKYLGSSSWAIANSETVKANASTVLEEALKKMSLENDSLGHRLKDQALIRLARRGYTEYLRFFADREGSFEVRRYLAGILLDEKDFQGAGEQFETIYDEAREPKVRLQAIKGALACSEELLKNSQGKLAEVPSDIPYSAVENSFIVRSEKFVRTFPGTTESAGVTYRMAQLQYRHKDMTKASEWFGHLIRTQPKSKEAVSAAYLNLDLLNQGKDITVLIEECKLYLKLGLEGPTFRADVGKILRQAELKQIAELEKEELYERAADAYLQYAKGVGAVDPSLLPSALNNASVDYRKARLEKKALEVDLGFLSRFPKHALSEQIQLRVAHTYELMGRFAEASRSFALFASNYSKNEQAASALRFSAFYARGSGDLELAAKLLADYQMKFPGHASEVEKEFIFLQKELGASNVKVKGIGPGEIPKRLTHADDFIRVTRLAELHPKDRDGLRRSTQRNLLAYADLSPRRIKQSATAIELYAKLKFSHEKYFQNKFDEISLNVDLDLLEMTLQRKVSLLKRLEQDYLEIAKLGSEEWGLASVSMAAGNYAKLAKDIEAAPVPSELEGGALEAYREGVQSTFVRPFEEKARRLAGRCVGDASRLKILSRWTGKCQKFVDQGGAENTESARGLASADLELALDTNAELASSSIEKILAMLEENPGEAPLLNRLAILYSHRNDYQGAKAVWLSLVSREKNKSEAFNNLGLLELAFGHEAEGHFYLSQSAAAHCSEATRNISKLEKTYRYDALVMNPLVADKAFTIHVNAK